MEGAWCWNGAFIISPFLYELAKHGCVQQQQGLTEALASFQMLLPSSLSGNNSTALAPG